MNILIVDVIANISTVIMFLLVVSNVIGEGLIHSHNFSCENIIEIANIMWFSSEGKKNNFISTLINLYPKHVEIVFDKPRCVL